MRTRICVTGLRGFPNVMGGIEAHCENLYTQISRSTDDFDILVLARAPYVERGAELAPHLAVKPIWTLKSKALETVLHTALSTLYARFVAKGAVLHIHAIGPGLFAPLARALGLRVVGTHHGRDYDRLKWGRMAKLFLCFGEWCLVHSAHHVICVSRWNTEKLKSAYPALAHKISHIPNGAAMPEAATASREILDELGLTPGRYILGVGRLVPEKGFQDLIAAYNRMDLAHALVIVGEADHADSFSRKLARQASARVVFAGRRQRHELATLYREAGLFVLPSYHEGHPIVALEALQAGAPILLSDIDANRDIELAPTHYFPVGDVDQLTERLTTTDFDTLCVRDSAILARYRWEDIAERTVAVLRQVLDERGRSAR